MKRSWTFGKKLMVAFVTLAALTTIMSVVTVYALTAVVAGKDEVISTHGERLLDVKNLQISVEQRVAAARGFLLTGEQLYNDTQDAEQSEFARILGRMRDGTVEAEQSRVLERIHQSNEEHIAAVRKAVELSRSAAERDAVADYFNEQVAPKYRRLHSELDAFAQRESELRDAAMQASSDSASTASRLTVGLAATVIVVAIVVALILTRTLARQIGATVQHMQSSSTELQSAASQQASSSKEQVSAVQEMQTTMKELLATAKQIGESARHVADVAREAEAATRSGDDTVKNGKESIRIVQQQVELVVSQMLDLGRKSQQIGGVLEIINELAEQTNILAVNATIEAAGAGELGSRFAAVSDEIRKLADRVGGSTREIRTLIEDIRSSVNATVMATESSSKAVDAGARQFEEITNALGKLGDLVKNTAEAACEIELSTNQQATAIEQVDSAVTDVSRAAQESDASAVQTLQTATQLTALSGELFRLVQEAKEGFEHG